MSKDTQNTYVIQKLAELGIQGAGFVLNKSGPATVVNAAIEIYTNREAIANTCDRYIKDEANNYKEYGNNPHLNFDPIAPLAGCYDNTNNLSNAVSSFSNSYSKAIIDDTSRSLGTMPYSDYKVSESSNNSTGFLGLANYTSGDVGFLGSNSFNSGSSVFNFKSGSSGFNFDKF